MPPVIDKSGLIEDGWQRLDDGEAIGSRTSVIVSLSRLEKEWEHLQSLPVKLGVLLEPTSDIGNLTPYLGHIKIVLLPFGVFSDGRAFSQAKLLRDRYAFNGNIRAIGDVIPDQLQFMQRCGFNQFEISEQVDLQLAFRAFTEITLSYQPGLNKSLYSE